jgi:hypothetical protein
LTQDVPCIIIIFASDRRNAYGGVPEWPKGADCKSVSDAFEGSNPSPSTKCQNNIVLTEVRCEKWDQTTDHKVGANTRFA